MFFAFFLDCTIQDSPRQHIEVAIFAIIFRQIFPFEFFLDGIAFALNLFVLCLCFFELLFVILPLLIDLVLIYSVYCFASFVYCVIYGMTRPT